MVADPTAFRSIREALSHPLGRFFWISRATDGRVCCGDPESFYANNRDLERVTFDVSNGRALVSVGLQGVIKTITFFRGTYLADRGPGGWVGQDLTGSGPYGFALEVDGHRHDLVGDEWSSKTGLLGGAFPVSEVILDKLKATLLTFCPVSEDGRQRPRAAIHGMLLENTSQQRIRGRVVLPSLPEVCPWGEVLTLRKVTMSLVDGSDETKPEAVPFDLSPGDTFWLPVVIASPGDWQAIRKVRDRSSLAWFNASRSYYSGMTGRLTMLDDPFTAEFLQRQLVLCATSTAFDLDGSVTGATLGEASPQGGVNLKDAYHAFMPLQWSEPDIYQRGILSFAKYSVRPRGDFFSGGVTHSLGNSLIPVMMAASYYASSADSAFFTQTPELEQRLAALLEQVIASREADVWLFPSRYISDGYSLGDYHTGSNICAWFAFAGMARILDEVYGRKKKAERYRAIAKRIREAIQKHCAIDGPFGKQYIEGVDADGSVPDMVHDGEESDVTLAPVYGFVPFDDPTYRNYARFAVSEHNVAFCPETRGIVWERYGDDAPLTPIGPQISDATFPGYVTALANAHDRVSMIGDDGTMREIRRLTDVDGSNWWWPYQAGSHRGDVSRGIYKCGWSSGAVAALLISEFLGLCYDAPTRTLCLRPFSPSSGFFWDHVRLGSGVFSVTFERNADQTLVSVENPMAHGVALDLEVPLLEGGSVAAVLAGHGLEAVEYEGGAFLSYDTVKLSRRVGPGETERVVVMLAGAS